MKIHTIKCIPKYFNLVKSGEKRFELRKDDRDYEVGDAVILEEWDDIDSKYTGHVLLIPEIDFIFKDVHEGLHGGHCIFSFKEVIGLGADHITTKI